MSRKKFTEGKIKRGWLIDFICWCYGRMLTSTVFIEAKREPLICGKVQKETVRVRKRVVII
ncbi:hypothetical protein CH333_03920 [candidate division WOR-3 bacterium JGI_Cruoil_03_44_89]|uniref:Uncharacterized protein n=1 Tax=candidate division WOR-3 bacterium JGI_Cruoil_03_44_89 TaxID=1973748 RepID=A0A235BVM9_UNCW3|nr:MAG: hypothetical protein CH333_03920 [candidate division WOR-3 bacterium JGI_Cruoil_03_44_89]